MIAENADTTVVIDDSVSSDQLRKMLETGEPVTAAAPEAEETQPAETKPSSATDDKSASEKPAAGSDPVNSQEPELPKGLKKRFADLTGEIRVLKEQLAAKDKPAVSSDKPGVASPAAVSEAPKEPAMPNLETFQGTYAEYQQAVAKYVGDLTDYKLKLADQNREQKAERASQEQRQKDQAKVWNDAEALTMKRADRADYVEVADSVKLPPDSPASGAIAQAIRDSENGPELVYHLGKNPKDVERLLALSPIGAVLELGKIAASLTAAPVKAEKPPKPALPKPPALPAGGTPVAEIDLNDENLDQAAWTREAKRRLKQNS